MVIQIQIKILQAFTYTFIKLHTSPYNNINTIITKTSAQY